MKRIFVALTLAGVLAACGSNDSPGVAGGPVATVHTGPAGALKGQLPQGVSAAGVLKVAAPIDRAPIVFYGTGTTTVEGIDAEIAAAIGHQLGLKVTFVNMPINQVGPAVLGHRADMLMGGFVDIKPFEGAGFDFVDYLEGHSSVLVPQGNPAKVGGPDDLCGRTVGFMAGTAQQVALQQMTNSCAARHRQAPTTVGTADHAGLLRGLVNGKVQAVLDDSVVANYTAQSSVGSNTVEVVGAAVDPMPYGIGLAHDTPQLRNAIQAALAAVIHDGEYDATLAKWGGSDDALRSAAVNQGQ